MACFFSSVILELSKNKKKKYKEIIVNNVTKNVACHDSVAGIANPHFPWCPKNFPALLQVVDVILLVERETSVASRVGRVGYP